MATNRNIALCIIFSLLTCGIYGLYWFVKLTDELNYNAQTKTAGGGNSFFLIDQLRKTGTDELLK